MSRPELYPYQREGVDRIQAEGRILLADEPGLGKTRQAIEALDGGRVLVVAPKLILTSGTWDDEIKRWSDNPELWSQAAYTGLVPRGGIHKDRHGKTTRVDVRPEWLQPWDAIVLDEAHYVKGRGTSWTLAVEQISKRIPDSAFVALTGTPMPNWAHEVFTILRLLNPSYRETPVSPLPGGAGAFFCVNTQRLKFFDTPHVLCCNKNLMYA